MRFLHGFMGDSADWRTVIAALPQTAEAIDLPGHSSQASTPIFSWQEMAGHLPATPAHWVGYSMGGRIALQLALDHPERVASLTLLSTSPGTENPTARARHDAALAATLRATLLPEFLTTWYRQPVFASLQQKPDLLASIIARRAGGNREALAEALVRWGQGTTPSVWNRLHELTMPVQWLVGADDPAYVAITARVKNLLPEARIVRIPDAGHAAHLEQPEAIARLIREFLTTGT